MKKSIVISILLFCFFYPQPIAVFTRVTQPKTAVAVTEQEFDQIVYEWSRNFAQILQLVKEKHFKVSDLERSLFKAVDALLSDLDPHSACFDPKTYTSLMEDTTGEFFGIGIVIDNNRKSKDKFLTIIDTIPGGPADKAGIMPQDKIIEIYDKNNEVKPLEGMTTEEAISFIKGPLNSTVRIKVMRDSHPDMLPFDIVREVVKEQGSLSFHMKNQDIYYISLASFNEHSAQQIEDLLKKATEKESKGIILDLRNNTGGLLNSAVDIAGLFLDKGSLVVVTKDKNGKELERYYTNREPVAKNNVPILILINNYTASAAEILAGCLKAHSVNQNNTSPNKEKPLVFLVGTKTFGKGSVQEVIPVHNWAVKITIALYYLPSETNCKEATTSPQGNGIEPDLEVARMYPATEQVQWFTKQYGREQSFENHIKIIDSAEAKQEKDTTKDKKNSAEKENRWKERAKQMAQSDNQLHEAVSCINLLATGKNICPNNVCTRNDAIQFIKKQHPGNNTFDIEIITNE